MKKISKIITVFLLCAGGTGINAISSSNKSKKFNRENEQYDNSEIMFENVFGAPRTISFSNKPIVVCVDSTVPKEHLAEIERAVNRLNDVCEGLTFKFKTSKFLPLGDINVGEMNAKTKKNINSLTTKSTDIHGSNVVGLNMSWKPNLTASVLRGGIVLLSPEEYYDVYPIMLHEIMHSLGFKDVNHVSIMNAYRSYTVNDLTAGDIYNLNFYYPAKDKLVDDPQPSQSR